MIADRIRMSKKKSTPSIPDYVIATDADFAGTADGEFVYIGSKKYVIIPHKIKGVTVTKTHNSFTIGGMFGVNASIVRGVATLEGHSITDMSYMFRNSQATTLDISNFDTSNVTNMRYMFYKSKATSLDFSNFNTSNVTQMDAMFYSSQATTLDLSSFDTSNVTNMDYMFQDSHITTGYARTQADADKFNTSSGKPVGLNFIVYGHSSGVPFSIQLREDSGENLSHLKSTAYGNGDGYVKYKINDGDYIEITDNDLPILGTGDIISFYLKQNWGMMSYIPRIYQDGLEIAYAASDEVTKEITLTEETLFEIEIVFWMP